MRPIGRISTYMPFVRKYYQYLSWTTCSVDATLINARGGFGREKPLLARFPNYDHAPRE